MKPHMISKPTSHWFCPIKSVLILTGILVLAACNKDDGPAFSTIPEIELISIAPDTVVEFRDVLIITIEYRDGDGDLGHEDPDVNTIFVRDARLEAYDGFYIGPIAPIGSEVAITGQLNIEFPSLFLFGSGPTESTFFYVYIEDRAGNKSNEIVTPNITIVRE